MKTLLLVLIALTLMGCTEQDQRRTLVDANAYAEAYSGFDVLHFVVEANCDYQYFFDYAPMRNAGYYAYGYFNDAPLLLLIPKYAVDEIRAINWPMYHSVKDAVDLLNAAHGEIILDEETMYDRVRIELTSSVLKDFSNADYDMAFFLVFTVDGVNYIAFQRALQLVIYHEDEGFLVSSESFN